MCNFKVGDKLVRLESAPNTMWVLGNTPVTVAAIEGLRSVRFVEPETLVGLETWGTHCYRLYTPELKSEPTQKEQQMNSMVVSDLTPKKQRKLAALLVSKGYECSGDLNLKPNSLVRFNAKSFCVNFGSYNGGVSRRTYIIATDKKYKAILAEVLAALPVETPEPVEEPKLELKVGSKVRCVSTNNPEYFAVGAVGVWGDHRKITFTNGYWYKAGAELEVVPDDTPVTTDRGENPDLPLAFEVGCTVERISGEYQDMHVGAVDVVKEVCSSGVRLNKYQRGSGYHDTANLKVIKGA